MASIVDTSVKPFRSDMANAPAVSGTAGTLVALLDALLVTGFDTKSATSLVIAGGVATLSYSAPTHSAFVDSVILISGITGTYAALNGEQKVTALGANQVKFATNLADGTATGTISFKMAPAGWEIVYTGTNLRAYRSLDPLSTKMLLRVDDTNAQFARVVGYEAMTDINTGTGAFPTAVQMSGGGYWAKSAAANATANKWALVADSRLFLCNIAINSYTAPAAVQGATRGFGDIATRRPQGDAFACVLNYSNTSSVANQYDGQFESGADQRHAMPRGYSGLGSGVLNYSMPYTGSTTAWSGSDSWMGTFPSPVDGELKLCKRYFNTVQSGTTGAVRGDLPGLYSVPQSVLADNFKLWDSAPGSGALAGRNLMVFSTATTTMGTTTTGSANAGAAFIDITGPWR